MNAKERVLKCLDTLFDEHKGFCIQSHGRVNGHEYYNSELKGADGKCFYYHADTLEKLADSLERVLNRSEMKGMPLPPTPR